VCSQPAGVGSAASDGPRMHRRYARPVAREGESGTAPTAGPTPVIGADDFGALLAEAAGPEAFGLFADRPLCLVEVDGRDDIGPLSRFLPCVVVGVASGPLRGPAPTGADILVTDDPAAPRPWVTCPDLPAVVASLDSACRASPRAAIALAQLLRFSPALSVPDALVAESFVYSMLQSGPEHRAWLDRRPGRAGGRRDPDGPRPEPVVVGRAGRTLSIRLTRPDVHNAYDSAMRDGLVASLQVADLDPGVGEVLVTGAGPSFCSGGDLTEFGTALDPATAHAVRIGRGAAMWVHRCADRTEFRVHGACIGAGVELAAFAHRVVADPGTEFRLPEVGMGLVPGAGGTVSIPRRIGRHRTAFLGIGGSALSATTAADWGLVDALAAVGR